MGDIPLMTNNARSSSTAPARRLADTVRRACSSDHDKGKTHSSAAAVRRPYHSHAAPATDIEHRRQGHRACVSTAGGDSVIPFLFALGMDGET